MSSGEVLRNEVVSGSSRGLELYNYMNNGEPVPSAVMAGVIREEMLSRVIKKGFNVKVLVLFMHWSNTDHKHFKYVSLPYKI